MSKQKKRIAIEGAWVVLGQIVAVLGAMVGIRLITELVTPETYGEVALALTAGTLLNQVVFGPLGNAASRFYSIARESQDFISYLSGLKRLVLFATRWVILGIVLLILVLVSVGALRWLYLVLAATVFALLSGYNSILDGVQNAARQRTVVAWHQGLNSWARFLAAAGLIIMSSPRSTIVMTGYSLASGLVLTSQLLFLKHKLTLNWSMPSQISNDNHWPKELLAYAWPFAAWGWLTWVQQASDRWALQLFTSTNVVGQYAVLYQIGYYPIMFLSGVISQLLGPIFFQKSGAALGTQQHLATISSIYRITFYLGVLSGIAWFLLSIFHKEVFSLLTASSYHCVSPLIPWMALSAGIFSMGQMLSMSLMVSLRTHSLLIPKISTAIMGLIFNIIAARVAGLTGVVFALLLWSIFYLLIMMACVKKESGKNWHIS